MASVLQHGKSAVYSVAWNQKDSRRIASSGGDGHWSVHTLLISDRLCFTVVVAGNADHLDLMQCQ